MATVPIDDEVEGVFILDCLAGQLGMSMMGQMGNFQSDRVGQFSLPMAVRPILNDFGIKPGKNPRFLMVSGLVRNQRRAGSHQQSRSLVYVMEITTGKVIAYAFRWTGSVSRIASGTIEPLDGILLRPDATGGGS